MTQCAECAEYLVRPQRWLDGLFYHCNELYRHMDMATIILPSIRCLFRNVSHHSAPTIFRVSCTFNFGRIGTLNCKKSMVSRTNWNNWMSDEPTRRVDLWPPSDVNLTWKHTRCKFILNQRSHWTSHLGRGCDLYRYTSQHRRNKESSLIYTIMYNYRK